MDHTLFYQIVGNFIGLIIALFVLHNRPYNNSEITPYEICPFCLLDLIKHKVKYGKR